MSHSKRDPELVELLFQIIAHVDNDIKPRPTVSVETDEATGRMIVITSGRPHLTIEPPDLAPSLQMAGPWGDWAQRTFDELWEWLHSKPKVLA